MRSHLNGCGVRHIGIRRRLRDLPVIGELLAAAEAVLALGAAIPFPERPPQYVRALLYDYRFADRDTYVQTGQWWARRLEGLYLPRISLADFSRGAPPTTAPPLPGMPRRLQ